MWIESHQSLLGHRKTGRLSRRLCTGRVTAIGHLHIFWWWCLDNAPEGDLTGIDVEDIAEGACFEGDPTGFLESLVYAGFVDITSDGRTQVHDWHEFAGKLIERRKKDADRKKESRQTQDIQQMSDGCPQDGARTAYVPNLTVPNSTVPITNTIDTTDTVGLGVVGGGADAPSGGASPPTPTEEKTKRATTNVGTVRGTRLPEEWQPTADAVKSMREEIPGFDLRASTVRFRDHFRAAPGQRGVKVDWLAAWRNWVREDYRRANTATASSRASPDPKPPTPRQQAVATSIERSQAFLNDIRAGKLATPEDLARRQFIEAGLPLPPGLELPTDTTAASLGTLSTTENTTNALCVRRLS